jgi:hypothetical protein
MNRLQNVETRRLDPVNIMMQDNMTRKIDRRCLRPELHDALFGSFGVLLFGRRSRWHCLDSTLVDKLTSVVGQHCVVSFLFS